MNDNIPTLIAHRGYAKKYPENCLIAILSAFELGAYYVEIDVQCLSDGTVVIYHDDNMLRVSNVDRNIMTLSKSDITNFFASEQNRFGNSFLDNKITLLNEMVSVLKTYTKGKLLVELKDESLNKFGVPFLVERVFEELKSVWDQVIIISYNLESLEYARNNHACDVAWVLTTWDEDSRIQANEFEPEMIITNFTKIKFENGGLWPGPWQWVAYEVTEPEHALELCLQGVEFIETMDIGGLLQDKKLKLNACEY